MPRGRRGRPRSNPAGRASPQAPAGPVTELPSPAKHTCNPNLQTEAISHASQELQLGPLDNINEQPPGGAQLSDMSPKDSTAVGDATGRNSPCPDPAATAQYPDLRSDAQPPHTLTGMSHAVDLQLRSSPAMANTQKSLTVSGK